MRKIYQSASNVIIWLGPDDIGLADIAVESIIELSDFLVKKLGILLSDLDLAEDIYQEVIFKNRHVIPLPSECGFSGAHQWDSLRWLYSHSYFTRVWVIQEINAQKARWVHFGHRRIEWNRVELVAGYIIMETAFSKAFNFSGAYCWWAAIVSTERIRQPNNWLSMLYLASNFSSTDARDALYGVLGLLKIPLGSGLLEPSYNKSTMEVYRDSVEAALVHFGTTDVLLYVTGDENPSWIPNWNRPMLFRNPFRFGKRLPWAPAGRSKPSWDLDKENAILSLRGLLLDNIDFASIYNEGYFSNARIDSNEKGSSLAQFWCGILGEWKSRQGNSPLSADSLVSIAASFSFGLDDTGTPADESVLLHSFLAYLKLVLDERTYEEYIPADLVVKAEHVDGRTFGKPVWDFQYPNSTFIITASGLAGCCVSVSQPGDVLFAPAGCTYPLVLRPDGKGFRIRGYTYVYGIMRGERKDDKMTAIDIR